MSGPSSAASMSAASSRLPAPASASLYDLLDQAFITHADAIAFEVPTSDGAETVTYAQLRGQVAQMANALQSAGVKPGDRVMAQVDKSIENVVLYLATLGVGAVYNPLNTAYTVAELSYFLGDAEPALVVVDDKTAGALASGALDAAAPRVETLNANGQGSLRALREAASDDFASVPRESDDLAALLYTSGTTGRSKGAMITHKNLVSNALTLHEAWAFEPDDVLLHALPIFHVHGLFVALHTALLNGSKMIWLPRFDAEQVCDLLPRVSVLMGVPTFYTRLLGLPAFTQEACRNMRLFVAGSAPLLAETHDTFAARTGHRILERYGMTEAGMVTSNPYDGARLAGTVGYALPGIDVRVRAEGGDRLADADAVGVLEFKGPNVFSGYWRNPEKTAEDFTADGYFISGDLATIAQDGRVSIVGRSKDLIISGGFNVYPKEIETALNAIPGVDESAVIGVPHPDFGEGVVAVITRDKAAAESPDEAAIMAALSDQLAKFKQPKRVFTVDALPRNAMGKVQKNTLRETHATLFKPGT